MQHQIKKIDKSFLKGRHRGPETSKLNNIFDKTIFGFHRLAINGLDIISNQPIESNNCYLICNGEIYNYKELINEIDYTPKTNSDCEIILQLYIKYGIEHTLNMLDGEFAFAILDLNIHKMFYARDPYGVRPLYRFIDNHNLNSFSCRFVFHYVLHCFIIVHQLFISFLCQKTSIPHQKTTL